MYLHWWCPAETDSEVVVTGNDNGSSTARLTPLPVPAYRTTVHDLPGGTGPLRVRLFTVPAGSAIPALGPWRMPWPASAVLPAARSSARFIPFGQEMALTGVEIGPQSSDRTLPITVRLVALRPILHDYVVSVSAEAKDGSWRSQPHDTVPALGAIPTLKWISGWSVTDPHVLEMPEGAAGPARIRLTVYDAFSFQPLPVLDERLAKLGQGIQMEIGLPEIR